MIYYHTCCAVVTKLWIRLQMFPSQQNPWFVHPTNAGISCIWTLVLLLECFSLMDKKGDTRRTYSVLSFRTRFQRSRQTRNRQKGLQVPPSRQSLAYFIPPNGPATCCRMRHQAFRVSPATHIDQIELHVLLNTIENTSRSRLNSAKIAFKRITWGCAEDATTNRTYAQTKSRRMKLNYPGPRARFPSTSSGRVLRNRR